MSTAMFSELTVSSEKQQFSNLTDIKKITRCAKWGRHATCGWLLSLGAAFMMFIVPMFCLFCLKAITVYDGSLWECTRSVFKSAIAVDSIWNIDISFIPPITMRSVIIYMCWLGLQLLLWYIVPGKTAYGQVTPAGELLKYKVNGLNCWIITHTLCALCTLVLHIFPASLLYDEWLNLFSVANVTGFLLTFFAYFKAWFFPTHPRDRVYTGSVIYDMFMGVELNPRLFGDTFDFKLFFNGKSSNNNCIWLLSLLCSFFRNKIGRPGIIAWTIINGSFAFKQYELHGYVSNSMICINILQAMYVVDFFKNESWYLRTIDICHDHFGFYFAWGDLVWLPYMYTLQAFYLVKHPQNFSNFGIIALYILGFTGYTLFRLTNSQKDWFRAKKGDCKIWGKPAKFIRATYFTGNGDKKESLLLTSGFWGISRHFNYVGDLMLSSAFCLTCGFGNLLPYFYIIYMTAVLVHRVGRDDARCRAKYSEYWEEYCQQVKWKILPGVY